MMSGKRKEIRTIVVIVLLVSSIFAGTVTMAGVGAAASADVFSEDAFENNSPADRMTCNIGASGSEASRVDEPSIELHDAKKGEGSKPENRRLPDNFAFGISSSTGSATTTNAADQKGVARATNSTLPNTGGTLTLSTEEISDDNTGAGNEVTVKVTYDEVMAENPAAVTVRPDVSDDLTSTPSVVNKRWSDSRTFKADVRYFDDNEDVSGVKLAVDGARVLSGNRTARAVSTTYAVDTANPTVQTVEVTAPSEITLAFDEGVYANTDDTDALTASEFGYTDANSDGASGIHSVSHTAGDARAVLILDTEITNSDLGTDTIDVSAGTISDAAGNTVAAGSHRYADETLDDVKPRVSSFGATESGARIVISFTVDEQLSSGDITIDGSSTYRYTDWNETVTGDGSYSYTVTHTPGGEDGSGDGTYTVALASIGDGRNTVPLEETTRTNVTVDTSGPTFGSLKSPSDPTNTTTPTIRVDGVSDGLNAVDETTVTVTISETDGPSVTTFSDATTTTGLHYRNDTETVTLYLSQTETSLRDGTTYDVTVTAIDDDESPNSNSKRFSSAFTVDTPGSNSELSGAGQGDRSEMGVFVLIVGVLVAYYLLLTAGSDF
ncbi:hypothetical protein [Halanaeroarchaeum sulfurireducens]|uniref:Putative cell surface glycoprotein n=1 Tax=Halanaeroarchaeum sulfurireducens TaxID=1604004 RepID=A0A0F7P8I1_9EURY|nr:hypothetical protein [Halanaeroarchaeum sulfurireducens]AKH97471.1 putative cell surface glycoprotein [Halanaeroarchaeum sulfurireducens]ALG81867.1 putative cell surface glycoprotein [Halanaeroarchaeum sulfurireducens]